MAAMLEHSEKDVAAVQAQAETLQAELQAEREASQQRETALKQQIDVARAELDAFRTEYHKMKKWSSFETDKAAQMTKESAQQLLETELKKIIRTRLTSTAVATSGTT